VKTNHRIFKGRRRWTGVRSYRLVGHSFCGHSGLRRAQGLAGSCTSRKLHQQCGEPARSRCVQSVFLATLFDCRDGAHWDALNRDRNQILRRPDLARSVGSVWRSRRSL